MPTPPQVKRSQTFEPDTKPMVRSAKMAHDTFEVSPQLTLPSSGSLPDIAFHDST
jgi:hypothetical protein